MDGRKLQDRISKGWGVAARRIGSPIVVYRPTSLLNPISPRSRVIKLNAVLSPGGTTPSTAAAYSDMLWRGVFDSSYTRAGDYLKCAEQTFFIVSQDALQPVLCMPADTVVAVTRARDTPTAYSGYNSDDAEVVLSGWPARLIPGRGQVTGSLPEHRFNSWIGYLPTLPVLLQVADVVIDDLDRRFVVASAQLSRLGWQLSMRQLDG